MQTFSEGVNFLSLFCLELQRLSKCINYLKGKVRVFHWRTEQQEAFDEIKRWLQKSPVLYMPGNKMRFHLYSDMSKFSTGSVLYQI